MVGRGIGASFSYFFFLQLFTDKQPAPPASLSSILESFRKSGEGDRDLLLSILGAKKAEEEVSIIFPEPVPSILS
jgi:hypothetical protein